MILAPLQPCPRTPSPPPPASFLAVIRQILEHHASPHLGQRGKSGPDAPQTVQVVQVRMSFEDDSRAASDLGDVGELERRVSGVRKGERDRAVVIRSSLAVVLRSEADKARSRTRSCQGDGSWFRWTGGTGNEGARLRPPLSGSFSLFIFVFFRRAERGERGERGSGGVRGSELLVVVECVRDMEGIDMDGEDGGEFENASGDSSSRVIGEAGWYAAVGPTSKRESTLGRWRGSGIHTSAMSVIWPALASLLGIRERD